jgi:hypothetical protein
MSALHLPKSEMRTSLTIVPQAHYLTYPGLGPTFNMLLNTCYVPCGSDA